MIGVLILGSIAVIMVIAATGKSMAQGASESAAQGTNDMTVDNQPVSDPATPAKSAITYDRATWPTGDAVWDICQAIAHAEGADVPNSNPDRLNNPGDLSDGSKTFGSELHTGSNVTHFPDKQTGWTWLYNKVANIRDRKSHVFSPDMTWIQLAQKYAGNWQNWVKNVTDDLEVSLNDRVGDYFQ